MFILTFSSLVYVERYKVALNCSLNYVMVSGVSEVTVIGRLWEKLSKLSASVSCRSANRWHCCAGVGVALSCGELQYKARVVSVSESFPSDKLSIQIRLVFGASY